MEITVRYHMALQEVRRGMLAISPVRLVATYGVILAVPIGVGTRGFRQWDGIDAIVIPIVEALMVAMLVRGQNRSARRLAEPTVLTLTDEGATLAMPTTTVARQWTAFVRMKSTKDFWFFYTTKQGAMVIPKRAFDGAQREQIETFVRDFAVGATVSPQPVV